MVCRDIKPDNILVQENPDGEYIFKLTDFGQSKQQPVAFSFVGTPLYQTPEMLCEFQCKAQLMAYAKRQSVRHAHTYARS